MKLLLSLLIITLFLLTSCKPVDDTTTPAPSAASYENKNLSYYFIAKLDQSFIASGLSYEQNSSILKNAEQNLSNEGLLDSENLDLVVPAVLKGAMTALSISEARINSQAQKKATLELILDSLMTSIAEKNTGVFRSSSKITSQGYGTLLNSITQAAIKNLDEAGVSSTEQIASIRTMTSNIAKNLKVIGVSNTDLAEISKGITTHAVGALDEMGIRSSNLSEAVSAVLSGVMSGLNSADFTTEEIVACSDEIAEGAVLGLTEAGVSKNDVSSYSTAIKSDIKTNLGTIGATESQISQAESTINNAVDDGVDLAQQDNPQSAGFVISSISGKTSEAGTQANFRIRLKIKPTDDVSIALSIDDATEGSLSTNSLTFTPANYNARQTVTVIGLNDDLVDGDQVYNVVLAPAQSADSNYNGLNPEDVSLTNIDDDTAGFIISSISGDTGEDGTQATFTVKLTRQPESEVSLKLSSSDSTEGSVNPASLLFTSQNWNSNQTVTVTGLNDTLQDGDQNYSILLNGVQSTDLFYSLLDPADVSVINLDDDTPGFLVSTLSGNTTEAGGTASFTVRLKSKPSGDVAIQISSDTTSEGVVSPSSLTFTPSNWNIPQTVTVTGVDDFIIDGNQSYTLLLEAWISSDSGYNNLNPADVNALNIDDETAGVVISTLSGNTTESGGTASFTVKLASSPSADVSFSLSSSDTSEGTLSPTSFSFNSGNWSINQTVTITGVDDVIIDGNVSYSIILGVMTSADLNYNGLDPADVSLINTDNDTASLIVSAISNHTAENTGGTATFTVKLSSQPIADVTIGVASNTITEGTASPSTLTFTSGSWNDNQTVTVTGVNDGITDTAQNYSIHLNPIVSNDSNYNGITANSVSVINDPFDGTAPVVIVSYNDIGVDNLTQIIFDEAIDLNSISINTSNTTCSGSVQISSDNFTTCLQFTGTPTASGSVLSVNTLALLSSASTYQVKLSVSDVWGNSSVLDNTTSLSNNIFYDSTTSLIWQDNGYTTVHQWQSAMDYCAALNFVEISDWRLPDKDELFDLYGKRASLKSFVSSYYWSSTTYVPNAAGAWYVSFYYGYVGSLNQTGTSYVRCVR